MPEPDRFESEVLAQLDVLYRAAWTMCRNGDEAEDLVQATVLKALEKQSQFAPGGSVKAWMLRILRNTWYDRLRHLRVVGPTVQAEQIPLADDPPEDELVWSDAEDLLENFSDELVIAALRDLPEHQRLALYLADVEQLPLADVAEILDVAEGTIKSRTSRARNALKRRLQAHAEDLGLTGPRG